MGDLDLFIRTVNKHRALYFQLICTTLVTMIYYWLYHFKIVCKIFSPRLPCHQKLSFTGRYGVPRKLQVLVFRRQLAEPSAGRKFKRKFPAAFNKIVNFLHKGCLMIVLASFQIFKINGPVTVKQCAI